MDLFTLLLHSKVKVPEEHLGRGFSLAQSFDKLKTSVYNLITNKIINSASNLTRYSRTATSPTELTASLWLCLLAELHD